MSALSILAEYEMPRQGHLRLAWLGQGSTPGVGSHGRGQLSTGEVDVIDRHPGDGRQPMSIPVPASFSFRLPVPCLPVRFTICAIA